ncbi:TPA: 4Fe-4S cluster-binding domain-containing protein, partial [Staphylococcus pseudintermedius]
MSVLDVSTGAGYIAKIEYQSFVDGEGVRCSVYVSGCPFQCQGCYNKAAQHFR